MTIKCTLEEYARMIRMCQRNIGNDCQGCVMANICNENIIEDAVRFEIEDHEELDIEYVTFERND